MRSPARFLRVLAGLIVAGALFGALAAVVVVAIVALQLGVRHGNFGLLSEPLGYQVASMIGGVCGAVLAPLAALAFWRHIPVWRLFLHLTLGTIAGAILGTALFEHLFAIIAAGALGFAAAGAQLSHREARRAASPSDEPLSSAG
jgi:hypothetical protein